MTDPTRRGNSSDLGPSAINPKPNQAASYTSRFTEIFVVETKPTAKSVQISRSTENLDTDGSAVKVIAFSVTKSKAPSAETIHTGYEKPVQPGNKKSKSCEKSKACVLPTAYTKEIVVKWTEGVIQKASVTGVDRKTSKVGAVAVVVNEDGAKTSEVEKEEPYEGDDELSSGEISSA